MKISKNVLAIASLVLILAAGLAPLWGFMAAAGAERPWHYFFGPPAGLLAVWVLTRRDPRAGLSLGLAALAVGLTSWILTARPDVDGLASLYVLYGHWLLTALTAVSAAARRLPPGAGGEKSAPKPSGIRGPSSGRTPAAPDLGWFTMAAFSLGLAGLAPRLGLLGLDLTADPAAGPVLDFDDILALAFNGLGPGFLGPLMLLKAAGERRGPAFAAGLALAVPALLELWLTACLWGRPVYYILMETLGLDLLLLNLAVLLGLGAALAAVAALLRQDGGGGDKISRPGGQGPMTLALVPAGAAVLAFFLILGYHQGRSLPKAAPWTGSLVRVKVAEVEIGVPPGFQEGMMSFRLSPGWRGLRFDETLRDSARPIDLEMGQSLGLRDGLDQNTLARLRELEARGGPSAAAELFHANVSAELGRDLSDEIGRPARIGVKTSRHRRLDNDEPVHRAEMTLAVRVGDTGLIRLSESRWADQNILGDETGPDFDEAWRAFQKRAADDFTARSLNFFQQGQWRTSPWEDRKNGEPGFYTRFVRLPRSGHYQRARITFGDRKKKMTLRIERRFQPRRSGTWADRREPDSRPDSVPAVIRAYCQGRRFWSEPLTVAGQPGRLSFEYPARPWLFQGPRMDRSIRLEWRGDGLEAGGAREKFPYQLVLAGVAGRAGVAGGDLTAESAEFLGLGLNLFRSAGVDSQ